MGSFVEYVRTFRSIHADLSCKWADFSFSLPILLLCLYFIKHVCLPPQCNDHKTKIEPCRKCTTCAAYKMGLIPMAGETARTQQAERAREKEPWSVCAEKINLYMKVDLARNHWSYLIWKKSSAYEGCWVSNSSGAADDTQGRKLTTSLILWDLFYWINRHMTICPVG